MEIKKLFFTIFFTILITKNIVGQEYTIRGFVKDSLSQPIPYSSVQSTDNTVGTVTDINGYFVLPSNQIPIKIEIRNIGYQDTTLLVKYTDNTLNIRLRQKIIKLKEIVIQENNPKTIFLGSPKNPKGTHGFSTIYPFRQLGLMINNNQLYHKARLISIYVKIVRPPIGTKPDGTNQLRLRMYKIKNGDEVGGEVTQKNIFLSPKKGGWYKLELDDIYLNLPKKGFLIAVEWIENQPFEKWGKDSNFFSYGLLIDGHVDKTKKNIDYTTWWYDPLKNTWSKAKARLPNDVNPIPCFRLEYIETD